MEGSIQLNASQRKALTAACQRGPTVRVARRAQVVLLLAAGFSWRQIRAVAFVSFELITDCLQRWRRGGIAGVLEEPQQPKPMPHWLARILNWITLRQPQEFGYHRGRWSCAALAENLAWEGGPRLSAETVRRGLRRFGWVWRRPRPIVGLNDPEYDHKLRQIHQLLAALPDDETAVFQDEVDVHLNPKIGSCWMPRGQQSTVVTPGNNEKRHVAGSLHWQTGALIVSSPQKRRDSQLFIAHLDDLRRRLRGFRCIHVICDNAAFHRSRAVWKYLAKWQHRLRLHFLPKYAPETNPIERVWWHFHETITRNHRCHSLNELLDRAHAWFHDTQHRFFIEMRNTYQDAA